MSILDDIRLAKVIDPRILIDEPKIYSVLSSASQNTFKTITTTSYSTSQISFSAPPPAQFLCVDRAVQLTVPFQIALVGTSPVGGMLGNAYGSVLAIRQKALQQTIQTLTSTINGFQLTINPFLIMEPILRFSVDSKKQANQLSGSPSFYDYYQNYHDAVTFGSNFNPLSTNALYAYQVGNGNFPVVISNNTSTTATLNFSLTEPLFLPPYAFSNVTNSVGFYNVSQMDFTITFIANLSRLLQFDANNTNGYTITSMVITIPSTPTLTFQYLTPPSNIPRQTSVKYAHKYLYQYITNVGTYPSNPISPGQSVIQQTQILNLSYIPNRIYVLARRATQDRQSALAYTYTDTYGLITNIRLDFGNQTNLLSNMNQQQLYAMTLRNGWQLNNSFTTNYTGNVEAIEPGLDFPLEEGQAPGQKMSINAQFTVTFTNIAQTGSTPFNFELVVITETDGIFILAQEQAQLQTAPLTMEDVKGTMNTELVSAYKSTDIQFGGDIWEDIKKGFSTVGDIVKTVLPIVQFALPLLAAGGKSSSNKKYQKMKGSGKKDWDEEEDMGGKMIDRQALVKRAQL